ncbi:hypothetical protein PPACK8108_LOCUS13177 [Phakopsora pachyrhizi]|uniref:Uncharacterized protein n=1 Tax=Phakopsora pachyrhizi TaxID=170000 RepID=A0AAV0B2S0_PHAPC|nr:hypothetical protein PPACK8108_LOCUS13177 [Phakopsora pachyrhizi]
MDQSWEPIKEQVELESSAQTLEDLIDEENLEEKEEIKFRIWNQEPKAPDPGEEEKENQLHRKSQHSGNNSHQGVDHKIQQEYSQKEKKMLETNNRMNKNQEEAKIKEAILAGRKKARTAEFDHQEGEPSIALAMDGYTSQLIIDMEELHSRKRPTGKTKQMKQAKSCSGDMLDPWLAAKVIKIVDVSYGEPGLFTVRASAQAKTRAQQQTICISKPSKDFNKEAFPIRNGLDSGAHNIIKTTRILN